MQKGKAAKGSSQVKAAFSGFLPTRRWTVLTPIVWDEAIVASTFASLATLGSVTRVPCLILRSANSYAGNEANEGNWTYLPATLVQSDMTIAIGKIVLTYSNPFSHLAFGRCGWSMAHRVHMSLCILLALVPPVAFQRLLSCKDSLAGHLKFEAFKLNDQQASYNSKDAWSFGHRSCKMKALKTQKTFRTRRAAVHQHLWYQPLTWCARKQVTKTRNQNKLGNFTSHEFLPRNVSVRIQ